MKKLFYNFLLLGSIFAVRELKSQIVLEALEGEEIKTYTCDEYNFYNNRKQAFWGKTSEDRLNYMCGRHYFGSYTIQYRFLSKYQDGDYDVYRILEPTTVKTGDVLKVLEARRHYLSYDDLSFYDTGLTVVIENE